MKTNQRNFINKLKPHTIKGYKDFNILPSLTIAQAILETGWGKASIGNNLFGIKANANWTGKKQKVRTHEYVNGKKVYVDAWFRDYDSIYESLEDRYRLLHNKRYRKVVGELDYKKACREIHKAGYATDPNYPGKLINIIERYKLHDIDKLARNQPNTSKPSNYAVKAWTWGKDKGITDGSNPRRDIKREDFMVMLYRLVGD